jgi:hypothetical protein
MPRSPAQSDFVVTRPTDVPPPAEASEFASRWVLRISLFSLLVLAFVCAILAHIPSGE